MSYWEPDDDGGSLEAAYEAGFWPPEDVAELRSIIELVDLKPTPGDRAMAALVLLDLKLNPLTEDNRVRADQVEDPTVTWAKTLLGY